MNDGALIQLSNWLSPSFPVGAYSYSHGLEWVVQAGEIRDVASLVDWLSVCIRVGSGRTDAILLAEAYRLASMADAAGLAELNDLACALSPGLERHLETTAQGQAFCRVGAQVWPLATPDVVPANAAYPVAVAIWAQAHDCPLEQTLVLYLHAFAANLVSAAVRLVPLGQTDGQRALAALADTVLGCAETALSASPDDLGGAALRADLACMHHESQYTRLFRS